MTEQGVSGEVIATGELIDVSLQEGSLRTYIAARDDD